MKPASPVVRGMNLPETVLAKEQKQYRPLPVWRTDDQDRAVLCRWRLSWWERLKVAVSGDLYIWTLTFDQPFQPIYPTVDKPEGEEVKDD